MKHDYKAALNEFPNAGEHFKEWATKTIRLSKEEYEAIRHALRQAADDARKEEREKNPEWIFTELVCWGEEMEIDVKYTPVWVRVDELDKYKANRR